MNWEVVGVIFTGVALIGAILVHLFKTAWWMSKLTTVIESLNTSVGKIELRMIEYENKHLSKEDAYREMGKMDMKIDAANRRIDQLQSN